jgi:hypothetical protein
VRAPARPSGRGKPHSRSGDEARQEHRFHRLAQEKHSGLFCICEWPISASTRIRTAPHRAGPALSDPLDAYRLRLRKAKKRPQRGGGLRPSCGYNVPGRPGRSPKLTSPKTVPLRRFTRLGDDFQRYLGRWPGCPGDWRLSGLYATLSSTISAWWRCSFQPIFCFSAGELGRPLTVLVGANFAEQPCLQDIRESAIHDRQNND